MTELQLAALGGWVPSPPSTKTLSSLGISSAWLDTLLKGVSEAAEKRSSMDTASGHQGAHKKSTSRGQRCNEKRTGGGEMEMKGKLSGLLGQLHQRDGKIEAPKGPDVLPHFASLSVYSQPPAVLHQLPLSLRCFLKSMGL